MSMGNQWDPDEFRELRESGTGIASFLICLLAALAFFGAIGYAIFLQSQQQGELDEESPQVLMLGGVFILAVVFNIIALILGLVGIFQPDRKRVFAILGTVFSILLLLGGTALIVAGQMME